MIIISPASDLSVPSFLFKRIAVIMNFRFWLIILTFLPLALEATNLDMTGTYRFQTNSGRTTVVLEVDEIHNLDSYRSGTIRLELWATSSPIQEGQGWTGYKLAQYQLNPLKGNNYYYNIASGTLNFSHAPAGTWYFNLVLTEYTGTSSLNDGYVSRDVGNFNGTFDGSGGRVNGGGNTPTPWTTPPGSVQSVSWKPQAGDRLTIEVREVAGQVVPPGTVVTYVFESSSRFHAEGGSSSVSNPQANFSATASSDTLNGVSRPCLRLVYDYAPYVSDPNASGRNSLFFYDNDSGVFSAYDQDSSGSGYTRGTFYLERGNPIPESRYLDQAWPVGDGNYFESNLGFFYPVAGDNWSYNYNLGWMYAVGDYDPDLWLYRVSNRKWVYVTQNLIPWIYFTETYLWYYFDYESNTYTPFY